MHAYAQAKLIIARLIHVSLCPAIYTVPSVPRRVCASMGGTLRRLKGRFRSNQECPRVLILGESRDVALDISTHQLSAVRRHAVYVAIGPCAPLGVQVGAVSCTVQYS